MCLPGISLPFQISPPLNMKNAMTIIKLFFFFFAKHLRVGNHLLMSCKQAKRTGQKRKKIWHHGHISWPRSLPGPCPRGVENPGTLILAQHSASMLVFTAQQGTAAGSRSGTAGCEMRYGLMSESLSFSDKWAAN